MSLTVFVIILLITTIANDSTYNDNDPFDKRRYEIATSAMVSGRGMRAREGMQNQKEMEGNEN